MRYLKALGSGLAAAVVAVMLYVLVRLLYAAVVLVQQSSQDFGGGTVIMLTPFPAGLLALVAFIAGCWWQLRRVRLHLER